MNKLKNFNINKVNLIICFIIPLLIWGPFFPDLIVSISALFFLYHVFKNKSFYYFLNKPMIFFFIFCLYCIFSSVFIAERTILSLESSLFYFRIGVFSCFIWYLIDKNSAILNYFYYTIITCFLVLMADGFFQYFNEVNIVGFPLAGTRVTSFFGDEYIMGSYLVRLFPLLFALFLVKQKSNIEIYFLGIIFILVDILVYISGERTAFFLLNLSTIFIIILINKYQRFRLIIFIISLACITVLSLNSSQLTKRMLFEPLEYFSFDKNSSKERYIFTPTHDSLIRTAYNMFKDKPILGHGPKMFRIKCKDQKYAEGSAPCMTHPHNFYLQLLSETGILGSLFLFGILFYVFHTFLRQFKSIIFREKRPLSDYQVCLLAGILITVWPLTTNGNFFNNWLMIAYSLPVGFYLQSIYSEK